MTFPVVIEHFGPTIVTRLSDLGTDTGRILHGEERIFYPEGPLGVGDVLNGEIRFVHVEEKSGSSGQLQLVTFLIELRHAHGRLATRVERVLVVLGAS